MASSGYSRVFKLLAPPLLTLYGIDKCVTHLEAKYPPRPDESTTVAFRTPQSTTQFCRDVDIYSARIPLKYLQNRFLPTDTPQPSRGDLQEAWARTVIGSTLLRTEASLVGLLIKGKFHPGDLGDTVDGFSPNRKTGRPRKLMNGILTVDRPPSDGDAGQDYGLLVSWQIAPQTRLFFEKIARWGYPWRFMSGGRHEISVSEPFKSGDGDELLVDVVFSTAHDYEIVPEEGGLMNQKAIPAWSGRLHRLFAMLILDMAVRELKWEDERREKGL